MKTIIFLVLLHAVCLAVLVPRGYDMVSVTVTAGSDSLCTVLKRPASTINVCFGPFLVKKTDRDGRAAFYVGYDFSDVESCKKLPNTFTHILNNDNLDTSFNSRPCIRTANP